MTAPWDTEGLWTKAKLFVNLALDNEPSRSFDERALWASLSLELLAKAALSRASPLLIAVPNEDGKNLLAAAGLVADEATFKTIPARTLFKRCARAFAPFDGEAAIRIAESRNSFLHSATAAMVTVPEEAWWPRYWALVRILVNACDQELEDFVGTSRLAEIERALDQYNRSLEERAAMLVERAKQRLSRFAAEEMRPQELAAWNREGDLSEGMKYSASEACPACELADGLLEGDEVLSSEWQHEQISEDDYEVWLDLEVASEHFSCPQCHLVLASFDLLDHAGLPNTFEAIGEVQDFDEPEYGND